MELWIRSQDKMSLFKINELFIAEQSYKRKGKYRIDAQEGWLGEYDTKERALQILDEIQKNLIGKKGIITCQDNKNIDFIPFENQIIVYEMPEN